MTMRRPRALIVLLGCLVAIGSVIAAVAIYLNTRSVGGQYTDMFDVNIGNSQPVVFRILKDDPALYALMLRQTKAAFEQGGWPAATKVFHNIARREIQAYAGDTETVACDAAWFRAARALQTNPRHCAMLLNGNQSEATVGAAYSTVMKVCDKALIDGGRRRLTTATPDVLSDADYRSNYYKLFDAPEKLTVGQRSAFADHGGADADRCEGFLKVAANEATLPQDVAARYSRSQLRRDAVELVASAPAIVEPPAELRCAQPGTTFTLSMVGSADGRPITWRSLGRDGWDCRVQSSMSGVRHLWIDGTDNYMQRLWPLAVGKTVKISSLAASGRNTLVTYTVISYDDYWLPWGRVGAYKIDTDYKIGDASHYVISEYWSPELGFKIGQSTIVEKGSHPDGIAPDWQLIAMQR